jgi:predicted SprT family Zn-dependent metalloprotease
MKLSEAQELAISLMDKYSLLDKGWYFEYDNAKRRFGRCSYYDRKITLSKELTMLNDVNRVKNTILHEIAHALVGSGNGHNRVWQNKAIEIGCDGKRCYSTDLVATPKANYVAYCPKCNKEYKRMKRITSSHSCGVCCKSYNPNYKLEFKRVK